MAIVNSYRYLGLTFSTCLTFQAAIDNFAVKATIERLRFLRRLDISTPTLFFKLFDARVVAILLYSSGIWGFKQYQTLERVHLFASKKFSPNQKPQCYGLRWIGSFAVFVTFSIRCDKYWLRLLQQPDTLNSKQAYFISLTLHEQGKVTLVTHIK